MREFRPSGKAVGKFQGGRGIYRRGRRRQRFQKLRLAGQVQNRPTCLGNPGLDILKGGEARAESLGYAIGRLALGKPLDDAENILPKPPADRRQCVGEDAAGFATRGAAINGNQDDLFWGSQMGPLTRVVIMEMTFGVVAGRTGDYIWPRMCGGCF